MHRKLICISIFLFVTLFIVACNASLSPKNNLVTPTIETAIPTVIGAKTMVSRPTYMDPCLSEYSRFSQPVGYKDIFPGQTTSSGVENILGSPEKKIETSQEIGWVYDFDLAVYFDLNKIVNTIYLGKDAQTSVPFIDILSDYGCPNIIYAIDGDQHPSGVYNTLLFIYHDIGMDVMFFKIPIQVSDKPDQISFFSPVTLGDYLADLEFLEYPGKAKPVDWDEAVYE